MMPSNMARRAALAFLLSSAVALHADNTTLADTRHTDGRDTLKLTLPQSTGGAYGSAREAAEAYLRAHSGEFRIEPDLSNLTLLRSVDSLLGTHLHFQQMLNGLPVENAEIVVSVDHRTYEVYQAYNNTWPVTQAPKTGVKTIDSEAALDAAWNHLRVHGRLRHTPAANLMYMPEHGGFRLVFRTRLNVEAPDGEWEHHVDAASGEIVSVRSLVVDGKIADKTVDFSAYPGPVLSRKDATLAFETATRAAMAVTAGAVTTNGTALIFDPDPRTMLKNDALLDSSAASAFTNAYVLKTLSNITYNAGVFSLSGPWVVITDIEAPTDAPSTTTNGQWRALRGNNAFNDAMCYYHVDANQRYLRSLGFTNVQAAPISVDSDGMSGADNSQYTSGANTLSFGHGGVDDDEDSDVILHEYGHAITYSIVPTWGGGDTGAIGEGFGDYWGGSYSYSTSNGPTYHPEWAFSWDGHSADTWAGRFMNMTNLVYDPSHTYSDHETISGIANYSDQLWSAPLFTSFQMLAGMGYARTNMDRIVIESLYGVGGNPTMRDMALATVNAARNLYPALPHARILYENFVRQHILPFPAPQLQSPLGDEIYMTGAVVRVRWDKLIDNVNSNVATKAGVQMEYQAGATNTTAFQDAMEGGTAGWTVSHASGSSNWVQVTSLSHSATHSWFGADQTAVSDLYLVSPAIAISNGYILSFWHQYDFETSFDGGVVEASTNGTTWVDIGSNATQNGYSSAIATGYSSPIAGRNAYTGASGAFVQTLIPLTNYAGRTVYVRFRDASDSSDAATGWWIDDVSVGTVAPWTSIGTSPSNTIRYLWTLPLAPSTNYQLQIRHNAGTNWEASAWQQSQKFIVSVDSDNDGIPDAWETRYFTNLTTAGATSDFDKDGFTDLAEYRAGTLPLQSNSLFAVTSVTNGMDSGNLVQWSSVSNRDYAIYVTTDLTTAAFGVLSSNLPATPPVNQYLDTNPPAPARFYQIRAQ